MLRTAARLTAGVRPRHTRIIRTVQSDIITVEPSRLHEFVDLYQSTFNSPPWNDDWSPQAVEERFTAFGRYPGFLGIGTLIDNAPVALAFGWPERWATGWHFHLKEMLVSSAYRRSGLGTALLRELEQRLAHEGITCIFLETAADGPARHFYEQFGFKSLGLASLSKQVEALALTHKVQHHE